MVTKAVEEAVGREVDVAFGVARGNPADRAWGYDRVERIMAQAVAVFRFVEMQVLWARCVHAPVSRLIASYLPDFGASAPSTKSIIWSINGPGLSTHCAIIC